MADQLAHRGPDDAGLWCDAAAGCAVGHRRLAILDLSPAGHQPMISASGRWVIAFNGEIYNHLDLRARLEADGAAPAWRGHSDTETLLAAVEAWGVEATLQAAVGMFAIALWDQAERSLYLARDRAGEKPLYYGWLSGDFVFGSELKAFQAHPQPPRTVDRGALALYLRHGYIPAPYTIWQGIRKLPPGTWLRLRADEHAARCWPEPQAYWSLADTIVAGLDAPFAGSLEDATDALQRLLDASVRGQMLADVPLGAFLSGGIDSSTVVATMQRLSSQPVRTFTIGFREDGYDEAQHARAVAQHLGTAHTELYVTPSEAQAVIPRLPHLYDEPFADSSQIPTFLVAQLARQQVTVALSGDAGDELFGGYGRYGRAERWRRRARMLPGMLRRAVGAAMRGCDGPWLVGMGGASLQHRWQKAIACLHHDAPERWYGQQVSHWDGAALTGVAEPPTVLTDDRRWPRTATYVERLMALDFLSYLPDDILVKVDRAAMGVSLETRVPLLDHRLIAFAWSLPLAHKVRGGAGKLVLRRLLHRFVPPRLVERPKMGFGVPIGDWLRGPLRDWAEGLLAESRLRQAGYLDPAPIRRCWQEHLSGRRNWQHHLWTILMWEAWRDATGV